MVLLAQRSRISGPLARTPPAEDRRALQQLYADAGGVRQAQVSPRGAVCILARPPARRQPPRADEVRTVPLSRRCLSPLLSESTGVPTEAVALSRHSSSHGLGCRWHGAAETALAAAHALESSARPLHMLWYKLSYKDPNYLRILINPPRLHIG